MARQRTFDISCAGYSVSADWYEGDSTNEIILSLIGWTSNRKKYSNILLSLCDKTANSALVFDYSGHGDSEFDVNTTRPAQHFLEVICVFDWLKAQFPKSKISVMGTSYGGFLAVQLTKYRNFDNLILRVPAIYRPEDFYTLNGIINSDDGWAAKHDYRTDSRALSEHPLLKRASNYKGNVLVVVHENDEQVPKETTDVFIDAFGADAYVAKGFPHSTANVPKDKITEYQREIADWINEH
jgi:uncharacterized protein